MPTNAEYTKDWVAKNPEKRKAIQLRYYEANKEELKRKQREKYQLNKARVLARRKELREAKKRQMAEVLASV